MSFVDNEYAKLVKNVLAYGQVSKNRTGTDAISTFGEMIRFNMQSGFPLLTTKKMHVKGIIHELLWFLNGDTNIKYLVENGVNIWNADAYREYSNKINHNKLTKEQFATQIVSDEWFANEYGNLGPIYGKQWTNWGGKNQIAEAISMLRVEPDSRRILVNAWNVSEISLMKLPPCHYGFQLCTRLLDDSEREKTGKARALSLLWTQRSADIGLGIPYNIASYAFLLNMIAQQADMVPDTLIGSIGNAHIYCNHIDVLKEQINRTPFQEPTLTLNKAKDIFSYKYEDFVINNYQSHPSLKMDISV